MLKLNLASRGYNDHYDKLEGDDAFSKSVSKKLADYWVRTGSEITVTTAIMEVLADFYNDYYSKN